MKKASLLAAMTAAVALSGQALAQPDVQANNDAPSVTVNNGANTEKCVPVVNGKNIVRANKGACASGKHSCAGQNVAGEADAWVTVPKGVCDRIKAGDFSDVPDSVKASLDLGVSAPAVAPPVAPPAMPAVPQEAAGPGTVADSADDSSAASGSWWDTVKSWFGM